MKFLHDVVLNSVYGVDIGLLALLHGFDQVLENFRIDLAALDPSSQIGFVEKLVDGVLRGSSREPLVFTFLLCETLFDGVEFLFQL